MKTLQETLSHFQKRRVTPELKIEVEAAITKWMTDNNITHPSQMGGNFELVFACGNSIQLNWTHEAPDGTTTKLEAPAGQLH